MFFDTLDKLRKKPATTKRAIALGVSISFTAIVGIVWIISFSAYMSEKSKDEMFGNVFIPFHELTDKISTGFEGIKNTTSKIINKEANGIKGLGDELKSKATSTANDYSVYDIDSETMPTSTSGQELVQ